VLLAPLHVELVAPTQQAMARGQPEHAQPLGVIRHLAAYELRPQSLNELEQRALIHADN
jgi:hypothetical protein